MDFEKQTKDDLHRFFHAVGRVDEKLPECIDLEEIWPDVEEAYLPDGVREYGGYPVVSLGWMMFVGMAMAKYWDEDWTAFSEEGGAAIYRRLRDARGYDNMDEYILQEVLGLSGDEEEKMSKTVGECAARVHHALLTSGIEPGTKAAVEAYIAALHSLYTLGVALELNALGYHMTKLG